MKHISAPTIGDAWAEAYRLVMSEGRLLTDGSKPAKEISNLYISVEDPQASDEILDKLADPAMLDWMVNKNFGGTQPIDDWGYSYGMRMHDFHGVDQIAKVVEKLEQRPESKSASIILMDPSTDFLGHMPCIVALDPKIRDGRLALTGFFRSQDIGKKFYADMMALASVQKEVADKVSVAYGSIELLITSAHVWETEFNISSLLAA